MRTDNQSLLFFLAQSLRPVPSSHLSFQRNIHDLLTSTDIPTLRALLANSSSSAQIFVALNNANYLSKALRTPLSRIHELDWWDERHLRVALPSKHVNSAAIDAEVQLSCTPSQHVSGRAASDRWHALWAAWVVDDLRSHKKVYFAGDTGYRTVRDGEDEDKVPVCPAFAEAGGRFGGFDLALLPIGCAPGIPSLLSPSTTYVDGPVVVAHTSRAPSCRICMPPLRTQCGYSRT